MIVTSNIINDLNNAFQLINLGTNEKIKQGEALLVQIRGDIQYPKVLFDYLQTYDISLGLRAAIELKLWFKEYRSFDDYQVSYVTEVVQVIKKNIVQAYMTSNPPLIHQLKDTIVFLASRDFPTYWPELIAELNACLIHPEYIYKALKLVFKLTEKYTYSSRSDPLYEEIIITCDTIHGNLLLLAQSILQQLTNGQNLKVSFDILKVLLKVFYNLNFQDLHPNFEDNLASWMEFMKLVLRLQPVQGFEQYLFKCKGEALKSVLLYATKYRDDFGELIQVFSSEIWTVCTQTNSERDGDKIVLSALKYFKNLIAWRDMHAFFQSNIKVLIESLIIKNLQLSKEEAGIFQDEPQEFIEKFFEQSDLESRRAQAIELFKTVTKYFTAQVNVIIQEYVTAYVQIGMNNPETEIILINLIIDGSSRAFTSRDGVSEIALQSEIVLGFYNHCMKPKLSQIFELQQANQSAETKFTPVTLAFYCRFLFYFRNVIDKAEIPTLGQLVSRLQLTRKTTLSNIACYTAQSLINVRNDVRNYSDLSLHFEKVSIPQYLQLILTDVYNNIKGQSKLESYSLKLMNSVIYLLKSQIFNALTALCDLLQDLLKKVKQEYEFHNVHLVFEIIASVVDNCTQAQNSNAANQLQQSILNLLDELLRENKGDVTNFVLQIYALFLQVQNNANTYYKNLLTNLLEIQNWDESNSSLFQAYIIFFQYSFNIGEIQTTSLQAILNNIVKHSPQQYTELSKLLIQLNQQWISVVLGIIFDQYQRQLQNEPQQSSKSKATHLTQRLIDKEILLLLSYIYSTYDIQVLVQSCAKISPQLLESFLINELNIIKSISQRNERRLIFTMLTAILFETQTLTQNWSFVFQAVVENMVLKKRNPIKFFGRVQDRDITSSSGFQPLKPIAQRNASKQLTDEDKLFCLKFKEYYSNPVVQQQLPITQLLTQQQQECLSSMIQSV